MEVKWPTCRYRSILSPCAFSPRRIISRRGIEYFIAKIRIFLRVIVIRRGPRATGTSGQRGAGNSKINYSSELAGKKS